MVISWIHLSLRPDTEHDNDHRTKSPPHHAHQVLYWAIGTITPALHGGSFPNDVAAIGGHGDPRMNPSWEPPRRETIMPTGNADWLRGTAPITPAPAVIGRQSTILPPRGYAPLAHHGAGACDVRLPIR